MKLFGWPYFVILLFVLTGCGERLVRELAIPLPFPDTTAHFEIWSDGFESRHELLVKNGRGEARTKMWTDWGPATHANLYVTPENFFIVIGGGGCCSAVEVRDAKPPRLAEFAEYRHFDSSTWTYLGAASRDREGKYRFYSPAERRECISTFGAGGGGYRAEFQVPECPG
ncbi:hypothetical protein ACFPOB_04510 [Bosea eneae]|uniref:Uncharacterized protein n=1 Tax=Bosea eneae TaxID=151454 RepID=A0ABW0IP48_9HYPH